MYFNYWWNDIYTIKGLLLITSIITIIFLILKIFIAAFKKFLKKRKNKLVVPNNLNWEELFKYLTENLNIQNSYNLATYLDQDYKSIKKFIKEKNYDTLNQLIISKYEKE